MVQSMEHTKAIYQPTYHFDSAQHFREAAARHLKGRNHKSLDPGFAEHCEITRKAQST